MFSTHKILYMKKFTTCNRIKDTKSFRWLSVSLHLRVCHWVTCFRGDCFIALQWFKAEPLTEEPMTTLPMWRLFFAPELFGGEVGLSGEDSDSSWRSRWLTTTRKITWSSWVGGTSNVSVSLNTGLAVPGLVVVFFFLRSFPLCINNTRMNGAMKEK